MGQNKVEQPKQWDEFPELKGMEFDSLVREYRIQHEAETKCKLRKGQLAKEIEPWLVAMEQKSIAVDDLVAVQCNGRGPSQISKTALVMAGVDPDIIAACTVAGAEYTYVQVKRKGEKN